MNAEIGRLTDGNTTALPTKCGSYHTRGAVIYCEKLHFNEYYFKYTVFFILKGSCKRWLLSLTVLQNIYLNYLTYENCYCTMYVLSINDLIWIHDSSKAEKRIQFHNGNLCLSWQPLRYTAFTTLVYCLDWLSNCRTVNGYEVLAE